jgi:hypothetical protein
MLATAPIAKNNCVSTKILVQKVYMIQKIAHQVTVVCRKSLISISLCYRCRGRALLLLASTVSILGITAVPPHLGHRPQLLNPIGFWVVTLTAFGFPDINC